MAHNFNLTVRKTKRLLSARTYTIWLIISVSTESTKHDLLHSSTCGKLGQVIWTTKHRGLKTYTLKVFCSYGQASKGILSKFIITLTAQIRYLRRFLMRQLLYRGLLGLVCQVNTIPLNTTTCTSTTPYAGRDLITATVRLALIITIANLKVSK